jgi:hypothetical protein
MLDIWIIRHFWGNYLYEREAENNDLRGKQDES